MDHPPITRDANGRCDITAGERTILTLSAQGKSIDEIAALLHLPAARVREQSRSAIVKLGARTYTQAVATAMLDCQFIAAIARSDTQLNSGLLSAREREVLSLSAQGRSMEEIAAELGVSIARVREHGRTATTKLGARTYTQAVVAAIHEQLIPTPVMPINQVPRTPP